MSLLGRAPPRRSSPPACRPGRDRNELRKETCLALVLRGAHHCAASAPAWRAGAETTAFALGADLERASVASRRNTCDHSRILRTASWRSSCAATARSSMRSCTGKAASRSELHGRSGLNAAGRHSPRYPTIQSCSCVGLARRCRTLRLSTVSRMSAQRVRWLALHCASEGCSDWLSDPHRRRTSHGGL